MTIEHDFSTEDILFPIESMNTMHRADNSSSNNINNDINPYSLDVKNAVFEIADTNNTQNQETPLAIGFPPLSFDSPLPATDTIPSTTGNSLHLKSNINKNYNTSNNENDNENNNNNNNNNTSNTNITGSSQYTTLTSPYPMSDLLYNMNNSLQSPSPSSVPLNPSNTTVNPKSNNEIRLSPQISNGNETLISPRAQQQTSINDDHLSFPNPPNTNLFIDTNPNNLNEKLRNQLNSNTNSYSNSTSNSNSNSTGNLNSSYFNSLNIDSMLDDYVSSELLLNDDDDNDLSQRRFSDVITNQFPSITNSRNSISHSLDLWNHPKINSNTKNTSTDKNLNNSNSSSNASPNATSINTNTNTGTTGNSNDNDTAIDNELTQILNEYNMNFNDNLGTSDANKNKSACPNSFDANSMTKINPSQQLQQQLNRFQQQQFTSSHNNSSTNMKSFNSDLNSKRQRASLPIIDDSLSYDLNNRQNEDSKNVVLPNTSSSSSQQFIKPSMILSDNASAIAKVATTGMGNDISFLTEQDEQNGNNTPSFDLCMSQMNMTPSSPASSSSASLATNHFYHHFPQQSHHTMNSKIGSSIRRRKSAVPLMGTVPLTNQQNNISSSSVNANGNGVGVTKERRPSYRRKSMTPSRRSSVVMESAKELEEKPFHCHICSKSFKRSEHLKRHVRSVHSNERPFACHICDKKFSRSDNLSQHIKTHKKHGDI